MKIDDLFLKIAPKLVFVLVVILIGYNLFIHIAYPSYISVVSVYNIEKFEKDYSNDWVLGGQVSYDPNNQSDYKLKIFVESPKISKHEQCHISQAESSRINSCEQPMRRLVNEMECYSAQYYPEGMFNLLYGKV